MSKEVSEARKVFLAAYRAWLVRYAIHLAIVEARKGDGTVELMHVRRLLEEDEVLLHGFDDCSMLWLIDVSRIGPFARRNNGVVVLMAQSADQPHDRTWAHPGPPPSEAQSVLDQVARVESAHVEAAQKRPRRARSA